MASNLDVQARPLLRIFTQHGVVEGYLGRGALIRTLDELNVPSRQFLFVHSPALSRSKWSLEEGPVVINKAIILFVMELTETVSRPSRPGLTVPGSRALIRVFLGDYKIQGFLHMPVGGDLAKRLEQDDHPFVALTSVTVAGPDCESAVPFLAVNRGQILSLQVLQLENNQPAVA